MLTSKRAVLTLFAALLAGPLAALLGLSRAWGDGDDAFNHKTSEQGEANTTTNAQTENKGISEQKESSTTGAASALSDSTSTLPRTLSTITLGESVAMQSLVLMSKWHDPDLFIRDDPDRDSLSNPRPAPGSDGIMAAYSWATAMNRVVYRISGVYSKETVGNLKFADIAKVKASKYGRPIKRTQDSRGCPENAFRTGDIHLNLRRCIIWQHASTRIVLADLDAPSDAVMMFDGWVGILLEDTSLLRLAATESKQKASQERSEDERQKAESASKIRDLP
jgi:hypothetical protein